MDFIEKVIESHNRGNVWLELENNLTFPKFSLILLKNK